MERPVIAIRMTQIKPELEEKFNQWYDETHVPLLLASGWAASAARYRLVLRGKGETTPLYLAIYDFKDLQAYENHESSPEVAAAIHERQETWAVESFETPVRGAYELIRTWRKCEKP